MNNQGFGEGFGQQSGQQQSPSPFGSQSVFGSTSGSSFGSAPGQSVFGAGTQSSVFASNTGGTSNTGGFGTGFGTSGFGSGGTGTSGFGSGGTGTSVFGSSNTGLTGFGSSTTGTSVFGSGTSGASGFGTGNLGTSGFGSGNTGTSVFGSGSTGKSGFGLSSTGTSGFGSGSSGSGISIFGSASTAASGFGTSSAGTSIFGSGSTGTSGFGSGSTATSVFGSGSTPTSVFGSGSAAASVFGSGNAGTSGFGAGTRGTPGFGSGSAGTSVFGSTGSGSSGFGTGQRGTAVFGSITTTASTFGTNSTGSGTSVFGSGGTGNSGFGSGGSGTSEFVAAGTKTSGFGASSTGTSVFGSGALGTSGNPAFGSGGFGTMASTSTSSTGQGFGIGGMSSSGFGSGTSIFATNKGSAFGTGGLTSSGSVFGTAATGQTGFGTAVTGQTGFGTASTGQTGFGTAVTGQTGFGTAVTGQTGFGTAATGQTGFGTAATGQTGFGTAATGQAGFGTAATGQTGFGTAVTGQTGFGTAATGQTRFGTAATGQTGFGTTTTGQIGFGTAATGQTRFGTTATGQTGFGAATTEQTGFGTAATGQSGFGTASVGQTGFGSVATGQTGLGAATSEQTGFGAATIGQTGFGAVLSAQTGFGVTAGHTGFGSGQSGSSTVLSTSSAAHSLQGMSSSGTAYAFGTHTTTTGFGLGSITSTSASSVGLVGRTSEVPTSASAAPSSTSSSLPVNTTRLFGVSSSVPSASSTATSSSIFGTISPQTTTGGTIVSGQTEESKGSLFPAAAAVSGTSVLGGVGSGSSGQGSSSSVSSNLFTVPTKVTDANSVRSLSQVSKPSVFGRLGAGPANSTFSWSQTAQAPNKVQPVVGAGKDSTTTSNTSSDGTKHGVGGETVTSRSLLTAASQGRGSSIRTEPAGLFGKKTSTSIFGGHTDSASVGASVFGGKKEPKATFGFSVAQGSSSGAPSSSAGSVQKRVAEVGADSDGIVDSKRGRGEDADKGTPERQKIRRSSSLLEDVNSKTSITCKRVPAHLNKGTYLRAHFAKFGKVRSVRTMPAKMAATIQFETHEAAEAAKKHGQRLSSKDPPISIYYKFSKSDKSPSASDGSSQESAKPQASSTSLSKGGFLRRNISQHVLSLPSSVADELASMGGSEDRGTGSEYQILDRPGMRDQTAYESRSLRRASPSRQSTPPPPASSASSSPARPAKVDAATFASLRKTLCTTTTEKISVLDARDKLLRQAREKHSGALQRQAFVGTCPDMCPEKERYYREDVRRLSLYEIIPGSSTQTGSTSLVDHSRAVKEYSRSSADQDEPLPHELRPLPVLTMTMNYLLTEIADRGEDGKWAEWYDFLWNRTRGIRKDITQQQLCSREVVELLERCARFHIYCSERLCTEDMMVFDAKINNENLTKCLQTLKEMYVDLENKHGVLCPNEAEFRAYMVLMNLNEGDTLREVQQLRADVRSSRDIDFAVKAYSALNSNNYVRFFRLVRNASFLHACILHRYFNQMRARALQVMLRAHTKGPRQKTVFPLSELVRLLVFENESEVREFCSYYGLLSEGTDLVLDRSMYVEPESSIPSWRAQGLVESKQMVSVGELINGAQLPPVNLPRPQCSFDEQGHFIGTVEGQADPRGEDKTGVRTPGSSQSTLPQGAADTTSALPSASQTQSQAAPSLSQQALFSNEAIKMVARDLFWEVIDEMAGDISQSLHSAIHFYLSFDNIFSQEILAEVSTQMAREISVEVYESEKSHKLLQKEAERRDRQDRLTSEASTAILHSTVTEEVVEIVQEELREARARDRAERLERCADAVSSELLEQTAQEMVRDITGEVHAVDVVARLQLLSELRRAVELQRTSQWFYVWRKAYAARQRQKRAMLDFPCAPSMHHPPHLLQSLCPDRPETSSISPHNPAFLINRRANLTLMSPLEAERRSLTLTAHLSLAWLLNSLQQTRAWQPLRLSPVISAPIVSCISQWPEAIQKELSETGLQWKMLLSLPGDTEMGEEVEDETDYSSEAEQKRRELLETLSAWLEAKFTHGDAAEQSKSQPEVLSLYGVRLSTDQGSDQGGLRVSICVRSVPEFASPAKSSAAQCQTVTKGTSAILFLLPHADTEDDTVWLASRLRLARLLEAKLLVPSLPLVLLLPCSATTATSISNTTTNQLGVKQLLDKGLLSEVAVVELPLQHRQPVDTAITSTVLQTQLTEAVRWLASRVPQPLQLKRAQLGDLVEDMMAQHFFTPILQDQRTRRQMGKLHQAPNTLIGLYNCVLDHLAMVLASPALQDISWPAPEFSQAALDRVPHPDWNITSHLADVYQLVSSLRLPWFRYQDEGACDWSQVCQDVWAFIKTIPKSRGASSVSLTSRVSYLLARACSEFENLCSLVQNEDYCTPTYVNAPWTDIVVACVNFRLEQLHNWKDEGADVVGGKCEVFYEEEDMEDFEPPAAWTKALLDTEDKESGLLAETVQQAVAAHRLATTGDDDDGTQDGSSDNDSDDSTLDTTEEHAEDNKENLESKAQIPALSDSLPENMRTALGLSQTLLLQMEEEKRRTQDFERYLDWALRGEALDPDLSDLNQNNSCTPHRSTEAFVFTPRRSDSRLGSPSVYGSRTERLEALAERQCGTLGTSAQPWSSEAEFKAGQAPLSVSMEQLKDSVQAQKRASDLFERRLRAYLES